MFSSTTKQTVSKRQPIQDQVRVNNSHKSTIKRGLARHKTQTTSLKFNHILKNPQKQPDSTLQSYTTPNQKINAHLQFNLKEIRAQ